MWIKFANLCRKSERMQLAEKTINSLLSQERVSVCLTRLERRDILICARAAFESAPGRCLRTTEVHVGLGFQGREFAVPSPILGELVQGSAIREFRTRPTVSSP